MHSSNPNQVMEFDSFCVKDEKRLLTSDCLRRIHDISQKPASAFIWSKSSHSSDHAQIKDMNTFSSSTNDGKLHFLARHLQDHIKKGNSFCASSRKAFKSAKLPQRIRSKTISIKEWTCPEQTEIDLGAPPPIDESFYENFQSFRKIKVNAVSILTVIQNTLSDAEMKVFKEMEDGNVPERDGILFPDFDKKFRNKAFSWACIRGLSHILHRLEASGADINNTDFSEATPVMFAAFSGEIACLKYLVDRGANLYYVVPFCGHCALHSAAAGNRPEAAEILLDNGADLNNVLNDPFMVPILHFAIREKSEAVAELYIKRGVDITYKNLSGETPLHVACRVQSLKFCELLLQKPEVDVNALDEMNRTPMHYSILATGSNIKVVELLLKNGALVNRIDKKGFSCLHIAALEEKSECVEMLIKNGADVSATTSKGVSALNIILRKIPESIKAFRTKIDSSITLRRAGDQNREFEIIFDFACLLPSEDRPETSFVNTFILENLTDLLSHPLVKAFLYLKWERIKKFHLLNILFYTLMVIIMSTYVLTALAYECYNPSQENNYNDTNVICYYFHKRVVEYEWYIWLAFVCLMIPRNILSFVTYGNYKEYLWNIENILDIIVIMGAFATSFCYTGKTYHWQKNIGAFCILCGWTNLMFMMGQLPKFGIYVAMFTHIQFEFGRLLFSYSGLLIGFALSFSMVFDGEPPFENLLTTSIKILTMMSGDLEIEGLTYHKLSICSQILISVFIIIIVVILMNLLVGIAVHDIKGLRDQASITKLIRTTKLILYTEMAECKINLSLLLKILMSNKPDAHLRKHVLVVRPLNPLERSLPRDILKAAYEIARKNSPILDGEHPNCKDKVSCVPQKKGDAKNIIETAAEKLNLQLKIYTDQVHEVKDQLRGTKIILEEIKLKLS